MTTDDRNRRERIAIPDDQTDETEYLTMEEAAALLRVPVATLRWWRSQGIGPPSHKFGRHVRYGKCRLLRWADRQSRSGGDHAA